VLLVLGGVVSVQVGAALAKGLFDELGAAGTVLVRITVAALVLLVVVRPRPRAVPRDQRLAVVAFGVVLAVMNLAIYLSFARIPLGVAVTIEFIGPLGVAVAGSRRARDVLWVVLAAAGVLLLTDGGAALLGGRLDPLGVALALVAGGCWAAYILLSQRIGGAAPGMTGLALAMAVGTVVLAPVGLASGGARLLEPDLLAVGAAVGLLSSALPYALEMAALRRLPARTFGVLMSTEPAVAALAGLVLLRELLSVRQVVAIGLICAASAGAAASSGAGGTAETGRPAHPVPVD